MPIKPSAKAIEKMTHPLRSPALKTAVLKLHKAPLYSVDGLSLLDGALYLTGLVLAPRGDPGAVEIETDHGVQTKWLYPLPNPAAKEYYWYWPNSDRSQYQLAIDLASSHDQNDAFRIRFKFDAPEVTLAAIKDTIYIPKDLRKFQTFPGTSNLSRVQYFDNINSVAVRGYSDYRRLRSICAHYGLNLTGARILDWGCGHGRVIRHFEELGTGAQLNGVDIDGENVRWVNNHLPLVNAIHGPLMPPLPYGGGLFNLVYGISVMTHLREPVQNAWLAELHRVTAPGGLVLLTFSGDTDVAFTSRVLDLAYIKAYAASGRGADLPCGDLDGKIDDPHYYKNVKVSSKAARSMCARYFEVIDVLDCMFGYQDLAVLRRT